MIDSARGIRAPSAPEEIVIEIDLEQARRRAKELLRAARAGDADALARMRDDRQPRLTDAQRAVAGELGFQSWSALAAHLRTTSEAADGAQRTEVLMPSGLSYMPGHPVRIRVRRREHRYELDDMGKAVAIAGRPPGWAETAARTVDALAWNINREGVVCMSAVEGRDIDALTRRTAEVSVAVLDALLELGERSQVRQPGHR
jgi:hypothetical protein